MDACKRTVLSPASVPSDSIWSPEQLAIYSKLTNNDPYIIALRQDLQFPDRKVPHPSTYIPRYGLLQQEGFLDIDTTDRSQLIALDSIHPLFHKARFDMSGLDLSDDLRVEVYHRMIPALALATRLMNTEEFLDWWIHALYGELDRDSKTDKFYLRMAPEEYNRVKAIQDVQKTFTELSKRCRFYWLSGKAYGMASYNSSDGLEYMKGRSGQEDTHEHTPAPEPHPVVRSVFEGCKIPDTIYIGLNTRLLYHLLSPRSPCRKWLCTNLRFHLSMAIDILHEVSHAFNLLVRHCPRYEPYHYLDNDLPEAGYSWQRAVFGADIYSTSITNSLGWGYIASSSFKEAHSFPSFHVPVKMEWVERWFLKSTWENIGKLRDSLRAPTETSLPSDYKGLIYSDIYISDSKCWEGAFYSVGNTPHLTIWAGVYQIPSGRPAVQWLSEKADFNIRTATRAGFQPGLFWRGEIRDRISTCYDGVVAKRERGEIEGHESAKPCELNVDN